MILHKAVEPLYSMEIRYHLIMPFTYKIGCFFPNAQVIILVQFNSQQILLFDKSTILLLIRKSKLASTGVDCIGKDFLDNLPAYNLRPSRKL